MGDPYRTKVPSFCPLCFGPVVNQECSTCNAEFKPAIFKKRAKKRIDEGSFLLPDYKEHDQITGWRR